MTFSNLIGFSLNLIQNFEDYKSKSISNRFFDQSWSKATHPISRSFELHELFPNHMFFNFFLFMQSHGLKSSSNQFKRMRDSCGQHTRWKPSNSLIDSIVLKLYIQCVIQPCKEAFFDTRGQPTTEKALDTLFLVNISNCAMNARILMKIS